MADKSVVFDVRCPWCNRPVIGDQEVVTLKGPVPETVSNGKCKRCKKPIAVCDKPTVEQGFEDMPVWFFVQGGK